MQESIQLEQINAYHVKIPMIKPFRISVGEITEKEFVVLEGRAGGLTGWGEAAVDGIPFYTSETAETVLPIVERVLAPLLKSHTWASPEELVRAMDAYRGHAFAKAALEAMFWDIYGQARHMPVSQLLGRGAGPGRAWVETGCSIGIKPSPQRLLEAIAQELDRGYRRIKIKVSPGKDRPYIEAARQAHPTLNLMVDANSAYTPGDMDVLADWDAFDLTMIEQPLDHDDLYYHSELCRRMRTPICLDESIQTPQWARCGIAMQAMDIVNIKVCRVGGLVNTRQIHDLCQAAGIPVWIGSRLGSGIAEAARLAAASLPNATYPSDIGAGRPYLADDLIEEWFETRHGCELKVPTTPGLGIKVNRNKLNKYTVGKKRL